MALVDMGVDIKSQYVSRKCTECRMVTGNCGISFGIESKNRKESLTSERLLESCYSGSLVQ